MQSIRHLAALAVLPLLAAPAPAQELVHQAQGVERRLAQTVRLADPWEQGLGDALFAAVPRDVETRIVTTSPDGERAEVQLLLHGEWGWFHYTYDESEILRSSPRSSGRRILRFAANVDGDEENEIVLLERTAVTELQLDESGTPRPDAVPQYAEHRVSLRYLDRQGGALVESLLTGDPEEPGFARLLATELGGPVNAALQLLAGDFLFTQERYGDARYRYQVAREWAERSLPGRSVAELSPSMMLTEPDPDRPEFAWITARLRHSALPLYYRKLR